MPIIIVDAYSVLAVASDSLLGETKAPVPLCCLIMCSSITLYCIIHWYRMNIILAGHQNKIISSIRIGRDQFQRQQSIRV